MTTLEQRITNFEEQAQELLDLPQEIANAATTQIGKVADDFQSHLNSLSVIKRVNHITGSDTGQGVEGDPYKTVQRALEDCPRGGICWCYVEGDLHISSDVFIDGKRLALIQHESVKRELTFERIAYGTTNQFRALAALTPQDGGSVVLSGWKIIIPPLDGNWGTLADTARAAVINSQSGPRMGHNSITLSDCEIEFPTTPFGALLGAGSPVSLYVTGLVVTGEPIAGKILRGVTSAAGTDPATLSRISTNLTVI